MHYMRERRGQDLTSSPRRGGVVKYQMAHQRTKALWGPARQYPCVSCAGQAHEWAYDGTDETQLTELVDGFYDLTYSAWPEFYKPLCMKCHRNEDRRRAGTQRKICVLNGCEKMQHAKGLCSTHYLAKKRGWGSYYRLLGA